MSSLSLIPVTTSISIISKVMESKMTTEKISSVEKRADVPLEEAINITGSGWFTVYLVVTVVFLLFTALMNVQAMSNVVPAANCELQLTSPEKGLLNSMVFAGMLFSGPLSGFLSDAYGRKRISFLGQAASFVMLVLSSLAPDKTTLMVFCFINGFALTGVLTPAYVLIAEFCPEEIRAKIIIMSSSLATFGNVYLSGMALAIMPLNFNIPIFGILNFSPWRSFLVMSSVPTFISLLFLWRLPETPKFLLNKGNQKGTLKVLRSIYAINQKKSKEEFPVLNVVLDLSDENYKESTESATLLGSIKQMLLRTRFIFSRSYILYTIMFCFILLSQVGIYNVFMLWLPEELSRIQQYSSSHDMFNMTLCDLMSSSDSSSGGVKVADCNLNYDFYFYCIVVGIIQIVIGILVSLYAEKVGKKVLLVSLFLVPAGISSSLVLINTEYVMITALLSAIITLGVIFSVLMSLMMDLFPTYVRSTAAAVGMIFGRLGAAGGSQLMGLLFENHCEKGYLGVTVILIATGLLCLTLPSRRNSTSKSAEA